MTEGTYVYRIELISGETWRFESGCRPDSVYYWLDQGRVLRFESTVDDEVRFVPATAVLLIQTAHGVPSDIIDHWIYGGL
jgi:hypothetical protein